MSKVDPHRRITLLPECLSDEAKMAFKVLFGKTMDELNAREANEILVRTCTKEGSSVSKMTTRSASASNVTGTKRYNYFHKSRTKHQSFLIATLFVGTNLLLF